MSRTWSKEDEAQKDGLERVIEIIDGYQQHLQQMEDAARQSHRSEETTAFFPFELVTQQNPFSKNLHTNTSVSGSAVEEGPDPDSYSLEVWIIDCDHPRYISALFQFIRAHIYQDSRNENDKQSIKHLKSIKPILHDQRIQDSVDEGRRRTTNGVSVLLSKTSSISYQALTARLQTHPILGDLAAKSTPYRIRVPTKRALYEEHYRRHVVEERGMMMMMKNAGGWPMVELDESALSKMMTSTMQANQRILQRRWTVAEVGWLLTQAKLVAQLALTSKLEAHEIGVGAAVSTYSLDPPEELAHLPRDQVSNPILSASVDRRKSSSNRLRHAVVELTTTVSAQDLIHPRSPETALHPIPYLLTNQIVFLSHEPCLLCSMALLHSRIKHLFFLAPSPRSGGCGSVYNVHEQDGLNHKFFAWKLRFPEPLSPLLNTFFDA
ncbi:adenosine deaminase, tRNA-specific 3 [Puccinia graminis f. sp. tritici]|uniref:Adenosine deaminase, tRNA-specific 3 n=1 Tax=Puccinia graminis f. sp. tritici TaxID=56615 RepID=A0A5B0SN48_PUCGR|nr:adenosine deaminase, tRNA-specific 3 [Puccinia graminis f. sp. tritici]